MEWNGDNGDKPIFVCASTCPCCEGLGFEPAFESWLPKMLALLRYAVHIQPPAAQADLQKGKPWQQWHATRLASDESSGDASSTSRLHGDSNTRLIWGSFLAACRMLGKLCLVTNTFKEPARKINWFSFEAQQTSTGFGWWFQTCLIFQNNWDNPS